MSGIIRNVNVYKETQFGVKPDGEGIAIQTEGANISLPSGTEINYVTGLGLENDIHKTGAYVGGTCTIQHLSYIETLPIFLELALGGITETEGVKQFYSVNETRLSSCSIEAGQDSYTHLLLGASVSSLEFSVEDGYVMVNTSLTYTQDEPQTLKEVDFDKFPKSEPLMFSDTVILIDGVEVTSVDIVDSFKLIISNSLSQKVGLGSRYSRANVTSERTIELEITSTKEDVRGYIQKAKNGSEMLVEIRIENANGLFHIKLPRCIIDNTSQGATGKNENTNTIKLKTYVGNVELEDTTTKRSSILATVREV